MDVVDGMMTQLSLRKSFLREIEVKVNDFQSVIAELKVKDAESNKKIGEYLENIGAYEEEFNELKLRNDCLEDYVGITQVQSEGEFNMFRLRARKVDQYENQLTKLKARKRVIKHLINSEIKYMSKPIPTRPATSAVKNTRITSISLKSSKQDTESKKNK